MDIFILFALPIVAAMLYVTTVKVLKKVKSGKDTTNLTFLGALLSAILVFGVLIIITTTAWR